ncbi:MAG: helix-turn-helix domain-containing protein [Prevotellaceae bacterium]|nr:helix-turn-helix domain-containing protein [Prevotellaceae bacterium]
MTTSQYRNTGYVEYKDIFTGEGITPSASIPNFLLFFDTFKGNDPLDAVLKDADLKIYQKFYLYLQEGEMVFEVNGKEEVIKGGSQFTIMPESIFRVKSKSLDVKYFALVIYPKLANQSYYDLGMTYCNSQLSLRHFLSPIAEDKMKHSLELYNEMKNDVLSLQYDYQDIYLRNLLNVLLIENINIHMYNPMPLKGDSNSRQYDIYCKFLAALNKHSQEHRDVRFYAELLGISSKYLSFVCISYSKKNASTWIDESVIQKARVLMMVHNYTISEISDALHFLTISSFRRFFKRVTGMTTKEYLRQQNSSKAK